MLAVGHHDELERRVVHWKQGAVRYGIASAGPVSGAVPSLLRDAKRDKCELNLAGLEQLEIFHGPLGLPDGDGQAKPPGQQPREPLAVSLIGATARRGADGERVAANAPSARPAIGKPRSDRRSRRSGAVRASCPAPGYVVILRALAAQPARCRPRPAPVRAHWPRPRSRC